MAKIIEYAIGAASVWLIVVLLPVGAFGQDDEECLECHGEKDFVTERNGKEISLYVDGKAFAQSVHGENGCVSCHEDADVEEFPHDEDLEPVDCGNCHDDISERYQNSLHGRALAQKKYLAPNCTTCHGRHNILPSTDDRSPTYVMNIPKLCGSCHKEGTPVSQLRTVAERHVLEDYSQSIHGDGLFKRGLIVTAVCTSCHTSHDILPHEDPNSTINRNNIAKTCMQCHAQIERVHLKVIRGELWEKKPHVIPSCVECHQPHRVRRVFYEESFPDSMCMSCHGKQDLQKTENGQVRSLYVDYDAFKKSVHATNSCIKCHTEVSYSRKPVCKNSGRVDCSMCHAEQVADYQISQHGTYWARGNRIAPYCTDCHGVHDMQSKDDTASPTFSRNIPELCGRCHREGQKAAVAYKGKEHEIIKHYTMSIHGKGLLQSGLMVTATCIDCHTAHRELPASDERSTVHEDNIANTCAQCHLGIYEEYKYSIHSKLVNKTDKKLPVCKDCHQSHTIKRVDVDEFRQDILAQCGKCHMDVAETYFETFHGKVSKLGSAKTAKCHDCHGAHKVLPPSEPESTLSFANVVTTCKKCHPNSNRKFVGYLTHATHHNKTKYPYLYYTFWFMTGLLIFTFSFFGLHTVLWLPRAIRERQKLRKLKKMYAANREKSLHEGNGTQVSPFGLVTRRVAYFQRFDNFSRFLHLLVILSFLSLAITGMTIKFSGVGVFQNLSHLLGGYEVTGYVHRVAAVITFIYFFLHIGYLIRKKIKQKVSLKEMLSGEDTLIPRKRDVIEFWQNIKWFLGLGPRPEYGKWTYWEKFDYLAVFWGVAVIGSSGLLLWFPEFFTNLGVPGWLINVATIIHSDEALLAAGFIFTIHFFNTHFRPDKFPMDSVIFTGRVSLAEFRLDRPREYQRLIKSRKIRKYIVEAPPSWLEKAARVFGFTALTIGIITIILIIYAMIFLYR
ncbi:MAG: cytochrome c3 family protein [candidate division KSB1 bacterium]|nr:cytochrome c3 family protein [candidate division KSB1 bacterium]